MSFQLPHRAPAALRSAFAARSSIRAPLNKRFFTPSAYNMTIKAYFDVSWEGPSVEVDQNGSVSSQGAVSSMQLPFHLISDETVGT